MKKCILFLVLTLSFTGAYYIRAVNQFCFALLAICCLLYLCQNGLVKAKTFCILAIIFVCVIIGFMNTQGFIINSNMPMYYAFWFIYSFVFLNDIDGWTNTIIQNKDICIISTKIWCILITICAFIPNCYAVSEGGKGFVGFTGADVAGGGNRLCPMALLILTFIYLCINVFGKKKMIIYAIPCVYVFFMGGSRTYFAVGCALTVLILYDYFEKKRFFFLAMIPVILIGAQLMYMSAMGGRIRGNTWTPEKYGDFWYVLTSGRSYFWMKMLNAFSKVDFIHKIFGNGYNFTVLTGKHWGHNDFIEILCTFGFFGLSCYLLSVYTIYSKVLKKSSVPVFILFLTVFIWLFNAFFNMFYTYLCAELSLPFMLLAVRYNYMKRAETRKGEMDE